MNQNEPMYSTIWNFVMDHHKKMNRGGPDMVIADYADQVITSNTAPLIGPTSIEMKSYHAKNFAVGQKS